jgi:hypothetical protein
MKAPSIVALGVVAALGASGACAQVTSLTADPHNGSATEMTVAPRAETRSVAPGGGVVVFIDPTTRKVRQPDAAEIGRLLPPPAAKALVSPPLTTKTGPGGAVGVVLDSSFDSFMVVTKKPDGTLAMDCVTGDEKAAEALSTGVKAASKTGARETLDVQ